jgi:hypothetical protein
LIVAIFGSPDVEGREGEVRHCKPMRDAASVSGFHLALWCGALVARFDCTLPFCERTLSALRTAPGENGFAYQSDHDADSSSGHHWDGDKR